MSVSRETQNRLERFVDLFQKWSRSINLAASSTHSELWDRHIRDSLQIYALAPGPFTWIDLGSGGGFPGVVTAVCLAELGNGWVHLVESNHKKASFLRVALLETGARGSVHPIRIETAPEFLSNCDRVSARALADLDNLCGFIEPWALRNQNLRAFFHKGRDYRREIEISHRRWNFDLVEHPSVIENDSVILEISHLTRKSA
jgi:16S rRNA (guanine527-N7)-methyltransferase